MALQDKKNSFQAAFASLKDALSTPVTEDRDRAGIIKNFEFTFETGWEYLRALLDDQGIGSNTPREAIERAFQARMIDSESVWLALMKDRKLTVHTYDRTFAQSMVDRIRLQYFTEFEKLARR